MIYEVSIVDAWEYRAMDTVVSRWKDRGDQVGAFLQDLNQLGSDGWELTTDCVILTKGHNPTQMPILLFKRRVPPSNVAPTR